MYPQILKAGKASQEGVDAAYGRERPVRRTCGGIPGGRHSFREGLWENSRRTRESLLLGLRSRWRRVARGRVRRGARLMHAVDKGFALDPEGNGQLRAAVSYAY